MPDLATREFNLLPHPRILPMLGEINLPQWRCVAELVDNSVDAFLKVKRSGGQLQDPEISVSLPMSDDASAKLTVRDNGPGMDLTTLENAVRAGWTSNDPINNLGMFGMGFNIATARLGLVTRVWTTRANDPEWSGLEINFETLIKQKHFKTPMLSRPKADPLSHGTEISVERLKPEQRQWLSKGSNRSKLQRELSKAYSTMLRANGTPISFRLQLNGQVVIGRNHCIWGGDGNPVQREVSTSKYGTVSAYLPFDHLLADRPFCTSCWQWLSSGETVCPCCNSVDGISQRQRRVRGWLGIQRYTSENEYGLDFLRNGRKIETANKDLFQWVVDGLPEEEYPIDDPRHRGRIVGEVHIDHCRVTYTKDRFDRNDPAWDEMLDLVRGRGPLRPDKASELGFGPNNSPLFLLFQVFRRTSPKPKVAGCYKKLLIVPDHERAVKMADEFHDGTPEYQTDQKWWELVEEADQQLLVTPPVQQPPGGTPILPGFGPQPVAPAGPIAPAPQPPAPASPRSPISSLTQEYRDDLTGLRWDVPAFKVQPADPELSGPNIPWAMKKTPQGMDEFYVNVEHDVFRSATMTPLDALLVEMSWSAMNLQRRLTFAG